MRLSKRGDTVHEGNGPWLNPKQLPPKSLADEVGK